MKAGAAVVVVVVANQAAVVEAPVTVEATIVVQATVEATIAQIETQDGAVESQHIHHRIHIHKVTCVIRVVNLHGPNRRPNRHIHQCPRIRRIAQIKVDGNQSQI